MRAGPARAAISLLVPLLVPALVVVPAIASVWDATCRASWSTLGRDQGIFQYVAWAIGQGDKAYRDVRDVNGPVIPMVHAAFQALGGGEEHRFRVLDLVTSAAVFLFAGAALPSLRQGRSGGDRDGDAAASERAAWAIAAWVALSAQYLVYGFWDTAQRESFLDWFVLLACAFGLLKSPWALVASGACAALPCLGKPTFALFAVLQLAGVLAEPAPERRVRLARLARFAAGCVLGLAVPLAFLLVRGDPSAWARITFVDVPTMYRFIWPSPPGAILRLPGYNGVAAVAIATSFGLGILLVRETLPRRALPIATMPLAGLVSVFVQAKGFPYHFHPVTLGTTFAWLAALSALSWPAVPRVRTIALAAGGLAVGAHAFLLARRSPDPPSPPPGRRDPASLESPERLAEFERVDFSPGALRDAAAYLAAHTGPTDRIQTYGMDAYVLFLAGRRSATPYIYAYDLNADAALYGSFDPDGLHPTSAEQAKIQELRAAHARDLAARLERSPPAAFVFVDRSPLMTTADAVEDFSTHCPAVAAWVSRHYRPAAEFEPVRIWLREDLIKQE
jgi:hypothetical protein